MGNLQSLFNFYFADSFWQKSSLTKKKRQFSKMRLIFAFFFSAVFCVTQKYQEKLFSDLFLDYNKFGSNFREKNFKIFLAGPRWFWPVHGGQGRFMAVQGGSDRLRSVHVGPGRSRSVQAGSVRSMAVQSGSGRSRPVLTGWGRSRAVQAGPGRFWSVKNENFVIFLSQ